MGIIMKKKSVRSLALAGAVLFILGCIAGGGNCDGIHGMEGIIGGNGTAEAVTDFDAGNGTARDNEAEDSSTEELSGKILMVGSTSMESLASALAERYMELHQNVTVGIELVGSGAGIEAVLSGTADIGNSSRNLRNEEKEAGAVENIVAIDGIVVCVDPGNAVTGLTKQQLIDIYTGAVTNWFEVGGGDQPIVVVGREAGAGTRNAFEEILGIEENCAYANVLDSTGAVMARVTSTPGAIGYVSLDVVDGSVIALQLDGIAPTAENIKAGSYLLCRPFVMATMGEISGQSELIRDWFEYVLSEEGQNIVSSVGLISV